MVLLNHPIKSPRLVERFSEGDELVRHRDDGGEIAPIRVAEILFPLHLIVPTVKAIPREREIAVGDRQGVERDRIRAEDGVEQVGEALATGGHALVGGGGGVVEIRAGGRGIASDVRVADGLRQPESFLRPRHGIGHRAGVGGIIIRVIRFDGGGFVAQNVLARDTQRSRQVVRQIVAAGIPQRMEIAPTGYDKKIAAEIAVRLRGGNRGGAMQWLLDVADKMEQLPQMERAIALGRGRILQHGEVGADRLHNIERPRHETVRWRAVEAERDVDEMPITPGVGGALEIVRPHGGGHKGVIEVAVVSDGCGDERIALGFHRRCEMVVGNLRDDHVAFSIPRAGGRHGQHEAKNCKN